MSATMSERREKMQLLRDFAAARNIKTDTVRKYMYRKKETFSGHTQKTEHGLQLDEVALAALEEIYPLPRPVEVVEDTESRRQLILAQQMIIQLQQQMAELQSKAALADAQQLLLEDKNARIDELQTEKKAAEERAAAAETEIQRLQNRSLWERIRNK